MTAQAFDFYCSDPLKMPPAEDSTELSMHTRALGIAFAAQCAITSASNFMKREAARIVFSLTGGGHSGGDRAIKVACN